MIPRHCSTCISVIENDSRCPLRILRFPHSRTGKKPNCFALMTRLVFHPYFCRLNLLEPRVEIGSSGLSGPSAVNPIEALRLIYHPSHPAITGNIAGNSDSRSDDADRDLSFNSPSPAGTPLVETSIEKMARFRRTKKCDKAKGNTNATNNSEENGSDSIERVINVKNCPYVTIRN